MNYLFPFLISLSIVISGCSGVQVNTMIENQKSHQWQIANVTAFAKNGVVKVSGHMKYSQSFAVRKGHVDIAVFTTKGELIFNTTATVRRRVMRKDGSYFTADLPEEIPKNALIKVSFHNDNDHRNHEAI